LGQTCKRRRTSPPAQNWKSHPTRHPARSRLDPPEALAPFAIEAQHPDFFLANHLALEPGVFVSAIRNVHGRLKNPPYTIAQYLEIMIQQGLVSTVADLRRFL
jgi:hypothetical protein